MPDNKTIDVKGYFREFLLSESYTEVGELISTRIAYLESRDPRTRDWRGSPGIGFLSREMGSEKITLNKEKKANCMFRLWYWVTEDANIVDAMLLFKPEHYGSHKQIAEEIEDKL